MNYGILEPSSQRLPKANEGYESSILPFKNIFQLYFCKSKKISIFAPAFGANVHWIFVKHKDVGRVLIPEKLGYKGVKGKKVQGAIHAC